jgi:hypothetical protein
MKFYTTFAIIAFIGLFAAGGASAGRFSSNAVGAKEANVPLPPIVRRIKRPAPIVMGRSVAASHRKSKLHHIKVNAIETEKPAAVTR